uniref:Uncharacterized protein n=1 Tax=Caenorhabditis japonica TaxID=281687 RepID=A0A8R1E841_CAEJA
MATLPPPIRPPSLHDTAANTDRAAGKNIGAGLDSTSPSPIMTRNWRGSERDGDQRDTDMVGEVSEVRNGIIRRGRTETGSGRGNEKGTEDVTIGGTIGGTIGEKIEEKKEEAVTVRKRPEAPKKPHFRYPAESPFPNTL